MTYTGPLSIAQEALRQTLAACPSVQQWMGVAEADDPVAEVLQRIYHEGLPPPDDPAAGYGLEELQALRPFIVIWTAPFNGFRRVMDSGGDGFEFADTGRLVMRLEQNCPDGYDDEPTSEANTAFRNTLGAIIDDLSDLAGTSPATSADAAMLAWHTLSLDRGIGWPDRESVTTQGLWQDAVLSLEYGSAR